MNKYDIPASVWRSLGLPAKTISWLINHVTFAPPKGGLGHAAWKDGRYHIVISPDIVTRPEIFRFVVLHELLHVLRGDLLAPQLKQDPGRWNISTDAVINRDLGGAPFDGAVDYEETCQQAGLDPRINWGAPIIYENLPPQSRPPQPPGPDGDGPSGGGHGGQHGGDLGDPCDDPGGHLTDTGDIREDLRDNPDEFPDAFTPGRRNPSAGRGNPTAGFTPKETAAKAVYIALERIIASAPGFARRRQSWRREGRTPLLPWHQDRGARLKLFVDVSASTGHDWQLLFGVAASLVRRYGGETFVFDTTVRKYTRGQRVTAGGGTLWAPVAEAIRPSDVAVILTDGYFADEVIPVPGANIVFLVTSGGNTALPGRVMTLDTEV